MIVSSFIPCAKANPYASGSLEGIPDAQNILGLFQNPTNNHDRTSDFMGTTLTSSWSITATERAAVTVMGEGLTNSTATYLDRSAISRSGVALANLGFMALAHDVSHEYGHYRAAWNEGATNITMKIRPFGRSSFDYETLKNDSPEARFRIVAAGLNQNSLDGLDTFRHSQLETTKYYHDLDKIYSRMYLQFYFSKPAGNETDDHTQMFDIMNAKGYDVTHNEFKQNSTLITYLSPDNWQGMLNVVQYLLTGKSTNNPSYLQINKIGIGLPSLSHFFTEDGDFVAYRQFFTYEKDSFELSADHDLDSTHKRAGLNRFRVGFSHHKRYPDNDFSVAPYAHMTLQRSNMKPKGINLGIETTGKISSKLFFSGLAEVNKNDLMARANGRGNGIWASIGLHYLF